MPVVHPHLGGAPPPGWTASALVSRAAPRPPAVLPAAAAVSRPPLLPAPRRLSIAVPQLPPPVRPAPAVAAAPAVEPSPLVRGIQTLLG